MIATKFQRLDQRFQGQATVTTELERKLLDMRTQHELEIAYWIYDMRLLRRTPDNHQYNIIISTT